MIGRLLAGSLRRASGRLTVIALAGTVAAGTVAAAAGLGARLAGDASSRLHRAGPNLLVRPQVGGPERLEAADVERVLATPGVEAAAGVLVLEAAADLVGGEDGRHWVVLCPPGEGRLAVMAATDGILALHPRWEVETEDRGARSAGVEPRGSEGEQPGEDFGAARPHPTPLWDGEGRRAGSGEASALVGATAVSGVEELQPAVGSTVGCGLPHRTDLRSPPAGPPEPTSKALPGAGILTTGEEIDRGVVVPLTALAGLVGGAAGPGVDRIEVRAEPGRLEAAARAIEEGVAGAEARPLVRVTETEALLARKLQLLVAGVGVVCLLLALATVGSATLALLDDRRSEIALFLSLGYTGRWVQGLLTAELALVGLAAVLAGGLLGEAGAAALARALLGEAALSGSSLAGLGAGLAAGCAVVLALIATAAALVRRRVERLEPAHVLQGR